MSVRHYMERFILLTWKIYKTQWNRKLELIWIITAPILLVTVTVVMRLQIDVTARFNFIYDPLNMNKSWHILIRTLESRLELSKLHNKSNSVYVPQMKIAWAPNDYNFFETIMDLAMKDLEPMNIESFHDCQSMEKSIQSEFYFSGICFDEENFEKNYSFSNKRLSESEMIIPHFNYSIIYPSELRILQDEFVGDSWKTIYRDDPRLSLVQRLNVHSSDGKISYVREGFINIQKAVSENYLKLVSKKQVPNIELRRFPVDGRTEDPMNNYITRALPMLLSIGFLFPAQILVWQIVEEKRRMLRVFLINMNIGNIIHYSSWFCKGLCLSLISSICIMIILKIRWNNGHGVLTETPWYVLLMVLVTYNVAATSFCLMIASFFKDSSLALRALTLVWLISYMPFFVLFNNREKVPMIIRYISFALPNTVLGLICEGLVEREVIFNKEWEDQGYALNYDIDRITSRSGIYIFLIMGLIFCSVGIYMDVWNTGESGGRRRRHIPAPTHSGDFTFQDRDDSYIPHSSQPLGVKSTKIYEVEPSHRRFKIRIKKLCKRYSTNNRPALNSFTWNVYENEVTVLMGHNGSGKTTLLKILAGLVEPTRGLVLVSDFNIQSERHDASMQLGLALTDDLLLPDFTVADQIRFVCLVKGASWAVAAEEIDIYTEYLHMSHLKQRKIKNLSAQERSLLNVCCAFAGGSPIVLIDDIHSDLDLHTQSLICGLINEEKSRRTIILVSNSTELASHLADRLAIMSNGELKCTGTKPFLRNMYGHGFRLTCIKGKTFDFIGLHNLLARYVPNPTLESDIGFKITYVLENKFEEKFPDLFDDLENKLDDLDIISFRLRDTSLDEIFLRFGSEEGDLTPDPAILIEDFKFVLEDTDHAERFQGRKLLNRRFELLMQMRWTACKRQIAIKIINLVALMIAVACSFAAVLFYGKNFQLVPLSFNLTQLHYIDAFVEKMDDTKNVLEMQESFTELLFWYDGHVQILESDDISNFYLMEKKDFNKVVNYRCMFGASFGSDTITVWFNNIPLHAAPFGLNLVHNVVARRFFDEIASIDVTIQPLPFQTSVNTFPPSPMTLGSKIAINLGFIFGNVWAGITVADILYPAFKKQHFLAGVGLTCHLVTTIFFDFIRVFFVSTWMTLLISLYLSPHHDLSLYVWIFIVLFLIGSSVVLVSYLAFAITEDSCVVFIVVVLLNCLGVIAFTISVGDKLENMNDDLQWLFQFTFGEMLFKLFILYDYKWLCKDQDITFISKHVMKCNCTPDCCIKHDYWEGNYGVSFDITVVILANLVPSVLVLVKEYYSVMACACLPSWKRNEKRTQGLPWRDGNSNSNNIFVADESVNAERRRVENLTKQELSNDTAVVCRGLAKSYGKKNVLLRIDLCVAKSECIGLLGYNNTGKTTIIKLIMGEERTTRGEIWVGGYSMTSERSRCYPLMGYASQDQSLPHNYTPRELLMGHAQLLGLDNRCCTQICDALSHLLGFHGSYRQLIQLCTTGQCRRVSFAMAILGDPLISFIDGAPGGIDPNGKRIIFSLTAYMQQRGGSFMFTNLSGWDCERMCHRTPVLFDGQLWTIGTKEQRYRRGYLLEVRFKRKVNADVGSARTTWDRINQFPVSPHNKLILFVQIKFPEAIIHKQDEVHMSFYIPLNTTNFSDIFLIIRKDAFELNIEDFYITRNVVTGMYLDLFGRSAIKTTRPFIQSS